MLSLHGGLGVMAQFLGRGRFLVISCILCTFILGCRELGGLDHSEKVTAGS